MRCKAIFNHRFVLGLSNLALSVGVLFNSVHNLSLIFFNSNFAAGMWIGVTCLRFRSVHWFRSNSFVPIDWCEQREIIPSATTVFLLHCARTSGGRINRYFIVVHWMVGDVFEQLLYSKYCTKLFICWIFPLDSDTHLFLEFQYFLVVLLLLLIEFSACLMIAVWPQCLGLNLDASIMVKVLQGGYGVPGKEQVNRHIFCVLIFFFLSSICFQLTAAIDLVQTKFKCCAINSDINYDTSLWRLQGYGQRDWAVPLTCCFLRNRHEPRSYLDPKPENLTMCQSLQKHEHNLARHSDGCLDALDEWYRSHYVTFLGGSTIVAVVEFAVLLSIILSCARKNRRRVALTTTGTTMASNVMNSRPAKKRRLPTPQQTVFSSSPNDIVYMNSVTSEHSGATHLQDVNIQKRFNDTAIQPYHISTSYLV